MSDNGYIYVLMNPSMQNLVKIGKTTRDPEARAKELSSSTGVPTPFTVVYDSYFKSCSKAEKFVHTYLESRGHRVSLGREFFKIPIKDAIDAVMNAKEYFGDFEKNNLEINIEEIDEDIAPWQDILDIAISYKYGRGDYIQDYDDAISYYLKAIKLGYTKGYQDIAEIYKYKFNNDKKAFDYYKAGTINGCVECYAGMGFYYLNTENNLDKALKSYELYIKYTPKEELFYLNICWYIMLSLKAIVIDNSRENIEYFENTLQYKDEILKCFKEHSIMSINHEYKSFYDLPKSAQNDAIAEYKKHNSMGYTTASFSATFHLGNDFLEYLKLIYSNNYISPHDFSGDLFENTFYEM